MPARRLRTKRGLVGHLRWKAPRAFASVAPFMSRLSLARVLRRVSLPLFGLVLLGPAAVADAVDREPPIAAPGQSVPPHAAGGWPTSTTGDKKKPARTPEQQAQLDAVANELKRLATEFGPDSVVLQAKILLRCTSAGAVGPVEVHVAGPSSSAGPDFLQLAIGTGLFFDGRTTTPESRRDTVWKDIVLPVLEEMQSFKIDPSGLEFVLSVEVQDLEPGLVLDPASPAQREAFRVELTREVLEDLVADRVGGDAVRARVRLTPPAPVAVPARAVQPAGT
jgi:hypothetical protein